VSTPRRVLVAVDGSVASLKAARLTVELATSWHAAVRAIAVADGESAGRLLDIAGRPGPTARERRQTQLRDVLDYVKRLATDAGLEVDVLLRDPAGAQPYELILDEADRWKADLLFVGRREHRGLGRALLGSQAEHVLEFARLPVVVVPEPDTDPG
jgi:nucleotide-binding universal stress UspA family protein